MIAKKVDVRFDIIWRSAANMDTILATAMHTFQEPPPGPLHDLAVAYETDLDGIAAAAKPGDKLLLKFSVPTGDRDGNFTPNGDGPLAGGRFPNLTLP